MPAKAHNYWVYIMCNPLKTTTYIGVTNNLERRVSEHKSGHVKGFTARYNISRIIFVEHCPDIQAAIARKKQLKSWRRDKKVALINSVNPDWHDLSAEWYC